jgi:hypothetical protein
VKVAIRLVASLACMTVVGGCAWAAPVVYQFTVTGLTGPLTGVSSTGTFDFDSSNIVPDGANSGPGLLTSLNFTWHGIPYTAATANTGTLSFTPSGIIGNSGALFGINCSASACSLAPQTEGWTFAGLQFVYTIAGGGSYFSGDVSLHQVSPPLPIRDS